MKQWMDRIHFAIRKRSLLKRFGSLKLYEPKLNKEVEIEENNMLFKYDLSPWRDTSPANDYYLSLHYLSILEYFVPKPNADIVVDVGSKTFFYASIMNAYFRKYNENVKITGVELDGNRRYENWFRRSDYAREYIKDIPNCEYLIADYLNVTQMADVITMFLPFVTIDPLLHWGLPKIHFTPKKLLHHAFNHLNPQGTLLIVNQEKEEQTALYVLLDELGISYENKGSFFSVFYQRYDHYVTIVRKYDKI